MHWILLLNLVFLPSSYALPHDYCQKKDEKYPQHRNINKMTLLVGGFLPSTPIPDVASVHNLKASIMPAVNLAVDHVHKHKCVLNGYSLKIEQRDSKCKASVGTKAFFDLMESSAEIVAVFGDACTSVNQPVALTTKYWDMVQLSYAETHPMFEAEDSADPDRAQSSRQKTYGTFYRMVPAAWNLHHARFQFLSFFNWTRVGTLKQSDDPRYALPHEAFTTQLHTKLNIKVVTTAEISSEKLNLTQALLTLKDVYEYIDEYDRLCSMDNNCDKHNQYHGYAYDGVWALSLALDKVIHHWTNSTYQFNPSVLKQEGQRRNFTDYLLKALEKTDFEGVTGKVDFLDNSRLGKIQISMFITQDGAGSYARIGSYDGANKSFSLQLSALNESGWKAPLDRTEQVYVPQRVHRVLYIVFCILSLLGMVLALAFLSVNFHYRNHKYIIDITLLRFIRMSSPNMNNLIIAGSLLTYLSVIMLGLDTSFVSDDGFSVICNAKVWVLCLGFTLAFGSMFSKTWRVHSIFTNIKLNKKAIRDYKLFLIVGVLVLIDIILLSAWLIIAPMKKRKIHLEPQLDAINNRKLVPEIEQCYSDKTAVFQGLIYGNKGLLMVLGCFLAWETRRVNVPALNDSKYIGMSVYNVVLMCIIGLSLSFILSTQVNESYLVTSVFIIFCTTLTLCLVFVPKIVQLVRNPKGGERKYRAGMMKAVLNRNADRRNSVLSEDDSKDNLMRAEQDNQVWHQLLDEKCKLVQEIIAQLREYGEVIEDTTMKDSVIESTSTVPEDPFGGVWLGGHSSTNLDLDASHISPQTQEPVQGANETTSLLAPRKPGHTRRSSAIAVVASMSKLRNSKKRISSDFSSGPAPEDPNGNSFIIYPNSKPSNQLPKSCKSIDKNLLNLGPRDSNMSNNFGIYCSLPDLSTSPEMSQYSTCVEMTTMTTSVKEDNDDTDSEYEEGSFDPGIPQAMRFIDSILSEDLLNSGHNKALPGRDGPDDPVLKNKRIKQMTSINEERESFETCASQRSFDYADYGSTSSSIRSSWSTCYEYLSALTDENVNKSYSNPNCTGSPVICSKNTFDLPSCSVPKVELFAPTPTSPSMGDLTVGELNLDSASLFFPFPKSKSMNPDEIFAALSRTTGNTNEEKKKINIIRNASRRFFPWMARSSSEESIDLAEGEQEEEPGHFWLTSAQRNRLNEQVDKLRDLWMRHTSAMNPFIIRTQEFKHFEKFVEHAHKKADLEQDDTIA